MPLLIIRRCLLVFTVLFFVFGSVLVLHRVWIPLQNPHWYVDVEKKETQVNDYFQYYQAGQLALSDRSHRVYDPQVQKEWTDKLIAPLTTDKIFFNQQPPFSYVLLIPLRYFPANIGYVLWCASQALFGLFCLGLLTRLGSLSVKDRRWFLGGVLVSFPAFSLFFHGNTAFFLLGFLSAYLYFLYNRKDIPAGIMLALSTFKPQYLLAMALPLVLMKRWKVMIAFALTEALLLALAIPIVGIENVVGYPQVVHNAESNPMFFGVKPELMVSIRGCFAQFLSVKDSLSASGATMLVGLLPLVLLWRRALAKPDANRLRWTWAVTITFAVFASPHAHIFDALLLSMAAALTLPTLSLMELGKLKFWHRIWCGLFILLPFSWWIANFGFGREFAPAVFFFPYVAILFVSGLVSLLAEQKGEPA